MKAHATHLLLRCIALLAFAAGTTSFADPPILRDAFGVRVTLNTGGYRFERPAEGAISLPVTSKTSFTASAAITNGSRTAVPFNFPEGVSVPRIIFKMFDSEGHELWRSEPELPGGSVPILLKPRATWKRTLRIPLTLADGPLPVGRYGLEAALANGDPVMASTIFEVVPRTGPPPVFTTMKGLVLDSIYFPLPTFTAVHRPVGGALVSVQKIQTPTFLIAPPEVAHFAFTGPNGRFTLNVPPGTYRVSAIRNLSSPVPFNPTVTNTIMIGSFPPFPPVTVPAFSEGSVKVTVTAGETSQPVVMMGTSAAQKTLIAGITEVTAAPTPGDAKVIAISAAGVVPTGGWTVPDLVSQELLPNGLLLLDFLAQPPGDGVFVTQAFVDVEASIRVPRIPGMTGVRVRSNVNTLTVMLPE